MSLTLNAILPIFAIILLGWWCRKKSFPGDESFWRPAERFIYFMLLPALFFRTAAVADIDIGTMWPVPVAIILAVIITTIAMVLTRKIYQVSGPSFTSLHQGAVRFNGYVAIAIMGSLYGEAGLALVAISFGILVPFINGACIIILAAYGSQSDKITPPFIIKQLFKNPLLVSSLLGLGFNLTGLTLPPILSESLRVLGAAALGLGLLAMGASLRMNALKSAPYIAMVANSYKLVLFPILVFACARLLGVDGLPLHVAVILGSLPGASASYLLAKQMGGDAELMSAIVVTQTLLSIITMSAFILWLNANYPLV